MLRDLSIEEFVPMRNNIVNLLILFLLSACSTTEISRSEEKPHSLSLVEQESCTSSRLRCNKQRKVDEAASINKDELSTNADEKYENGEFSAALQAYIKLARIGDKFSQYRLALMYDNGLGSERNAVEAFAWISVAAEMKTYPFVLYWADLKERLTADEAFAAQQQAVEYLRRYGSTAQARILNMNTSYNMNIKDVADDWYRDGKYERAFKMYRNLAIAGEKFSQYRAAQMYQNGIGVDRDPAKAYAWALLAAEMGAPVYVEYVDILTNSINTHDIDAGREIFREIYAKSSLLKLSNKRIRKLRRSLLQCTKTKLPGPCPELIQTVCLDNPDCTGSKNHRSLADNRNFDTRNIHDARGIKRLCFEGGICFHGKFDYSQEVKPGVNIYRQYEYELGRIESFIERYMETYGNVILGELEIIEDELDQSQNDE